MSETETTMPAPPSGGVFDDPSLPEGHPDRRRLFQPPVVPVGEQCGAVDPESGFACRLEKGHLGDVHTGGGRFWSNAEGKPAADVDGEKEALLLLDRLVRASETQGKALERIATSLEHWVQQKLHTVRT